MKHVSWKIEMPLSSAALEAAVLPVEAEALPSLALALPLELPSHPSSLPASRRDAAASSPSAASTALRSASSPCSRAAIEAASSDGVGNCAVNCAGAWVSTGGRRAGAAATRAAGIRAESSVRA